MFIDLEKTYDKIKRKVLDSDREEKNHIKYINTKKRISMNELSLAQK